MEKPVVETLFDNENLSLMIADDWFVYGHLSRAQDGEGVAVLVYKMGADGLVSHMLGRYEVNPAHADGMMITSITGGIDHGMTPEQAVEQELLEEAGIDIKNQRGWTMQSLGTCMPSKFLDMKYHLFSLDCTNMSAALDDAKAVGDGTRGEQGAYCKWDYPHVVVGCKCPLVALMAMRAGLLNKI